MEEKIVFLQGLDRSAVLQLLKSGHIEIKELRKSTPYFFYSQ